MNDVDDDLIGLEVGRSGRGLFWFLRHADEGGGYLHCRVGAGRGFIATTATATVTPPSLLSFSFSVSSRVGLGWVGYHVAELYFRSFTPSMP